MSQPSQNYIEKVTRWAYGGVSLSKMNLTLEQQFRARLCLNVYHLWMENKSVNIRKMVQRLSARDYGLLLDNAAIGNEESIAMVEALGIKRDEKGNITTRSDTEISNDVYVTNALVGRLAVSKNHIQRAQYEDNIEWLMNFGRETGNVSAIKEAQRNLEKINNDFQDKEDPQEQMTKTQINITGDVSVVKEGRTSLSDEERQRLAKKYGLTQKEIAQEMEEINGIWQPVEEDEKDIFVENEDK